MNPLRQPGPDLRVSVGRRELLHVLAELLAKILVAHLAAGNADHGEVLGQQSVFAKVVEGRDQLTFRQISRGAEDRHHVGVGDLSCIRH